MVKMLRARKMYRKRAGKRKWRQNGRATIFEIVTPSDGSSIDDFLSTSVYSIHDNLSEGTFLKSYIECVVL